jgi:hypothetical protein
MEGSALHFALGAPTKTLNELRAMNFRAYSKHRLALAQEVAALTAGRRPSQPFPKALLVVERHSAGSPDVDGLYGGLKPLLDVLQPPSRGCPNGLGIIADDSPTCLRLDVRAVRCARAKGKTVVRITRID